MNKNKTYQSTLLSLFVPEAKQTIKLAIPIVIAQLGVVLMGVADTIMIGRMLGKEALAAAGLGTSMSFVIASIGFGGIPVIAPIISKYNSSRQLDELSKIFRATIALAGRFSLGLSLISLLVFFGFDYLGQAPAVAVLAKPFFLIISLSNIAVYYFVAVKQTFDGFSRPKPAMYITFLGLLANVFFNYIFIDLFGLNGAAYSTLVVRSLMLIALCIYFYQKKNISQPFLQLVEKHSYTHYTNRFMRLGIPSGMQFFFEIAAFSTALIMMGWIGAKALAAHQIAINIAATTYMMAGGLAFAGGIRVGDALGSNVQNGVKTAGTTSFLLVFIFMSITMLLIYFFREQLISLYIDDLEIKDLASKLLIVAAIFQLSDGLQVVALGNLRGLSDVKIPAYATFMAYWLIALPLGYYLAFYTPLGAVGIWIALLVGLSIAAITLIYRFYGIHKRIPISLF